MSELKDYLPQERIKHMKEAPERAKVIVAKAKEIKVKAEETSEKAKQKASEISTFVRQKIR